MAEQKTLLAADLLKEAKTEEILDELRRYFKDKPFNISDVKDDAGHQYVDLVQEGGGVLGFALVGYVYVLEKMGIRFFSLAGTSAGSINALLLACCGNKEEEKTDKIIEHSLNLELFSLVDGKPGEKGSFTSFVKKTVQRFIVKKGFLKRLSRIAFGLVLTLVIFMGAVIITGFINANIAKWLGLVAGLILLVIITAIFILAKRFKQFVANGFGLNEGKVFHDWINSVIAMNHIENDESKKIIANLEDFSQHFMRVPKLTVIPDSRRENNNPPDLPLLTVIASEIIAQRKIEFPAMWDLYWRSEQDVRPGDFVRASMSIPVFFKTYTLTDVAKNSSFEIWQKHLNWQNANKGIPSKVQFIDGGILSNFPINVFYNPHYPVPRMPTFGIRLQDGVLDAMSTGKNTFLKYIASMFNTIRFNFDREFITKNRAYNLAVQSVDVMEHSWLNFFMKNKEKIELFEKGAQAAAEFLKTFNWEEYKTERLKNFAMGQEKFNTPNNLTVFPNPKTA